MGDDRWNENVWKKVVVEQVEREGKRKLKRRSGGKTRFEELLGQAVKLECTHKQIITRIVVRIKSWQKKAFKSVGSRKEGGGGGHFINFDWGHGRF